LRCRLKRILLIPFILTSVIVAAAGENGGYAGSYLRMGLGARALALGDVGVAAPVDAFSSYYNPSAFGRMGNSWMVSLSYGFLSLDRHQSFVSLSKQIPPGAGFSIGWIENGIGQIRACDKNGTDIGEIDQSNNTVLFCFGRTLFSHMTVGVAVKIMFENINDGTEQFNYTSNGVGFDFGMQYYLHPNVIFGYQIRDINSKLKSNTENIYGSGQGTTLIDRFPLIQKAGIFYRSPWPWLRVLDDLEWSNKGEVKNHLGIEALHGQNLALRMGLNDTHLTFGAGMDFKIGRNLSLLDYAFMPSVIDEGSSHLFSWQILF
jgi:hypothetical protein